MGFRIAAAIIFLCLAPSAACSAKDDHPSNLPIGGAAGSGAARVLRGCVHYQQ